LSETSAVSTSGSNSGPAGSAVAAPSGGGFSPDFSQSGKETAEAYGVAAGTADVALGIEVAIYGSEVSLGPPGWIAAGATALFELFDDLFGGSSNPPTPRQLLHGRHPLYPEILGIPLGLIPNQKSAGDSGVLVLSQAVEPGDDPLIDPNVEDDRKAEIARELELQLPNAKGKVRRRILERLKNYRKRPSRRAHGADIKNKFSFVPLVPEAPLAEDGALEAGEAGATVLELAGILAF
jgi:hypothetical protein